MIKRSYKFKICQKLLHTNFGKKIQFWTWSLEKLDADKFIGKAIMSEEANDILSGYNIGHQLQFCARENPIEILKKAFFSERLIVFLEETPCL